MLIIRDRISCAIAAFLSQLLPPPSSDLSTLVNGGE